MKKVDIFIVGEQKCGTTALHSFLTKHPQIKSGKQKEIDFFSYDGLFNKGLDYYHSLFKLNLYEKYVKKIKLIDASPSYLSTGEKTALRIYDYNKDANIIIMLRNPIERAFSAYMMYKNRFKEGRLDWWFKWMKSRGKENKEVIKRSERSYRSFNEFIIEEIYAYESNIEIECPVLGYGRYYDNIKIYERIFKNIILVNNKLLDIDFESTLISIERKLSIKNYDWKNLKQRKIFEGKYDEILDDKTFSILKNFYKKDIEKIKFEYDINLIDENIEL